MTERKINFKNVVFVIMTTMFGIGVGLYDRIINNIAPLENIWVSIVNAMTPDTTVQVTEWSTETIATTSMSGFGLMGVLIIVVVSTTILATLFTLCKGASS